MAFQRTISIFTVLLVLAFQPSIKAQTIDRTEDQYYRHELLQGQEAFRYAYLRESDVVWESMIWRTIDLHEKFNQFFFYPTDSEGGEGRQNFTYVIWNAARNGEFQMYEDDEFKIPIDNDLYFHRYEVGDTVQLEIYDDEDGEEFHYETVVVPKIFYSEDITRYSLKEAWYLDRQSTGQYQRTLGLAMIKDNYRNVDGEEEYIGSFSMFWVPFQSPQVRRVLVRHEAYYEDNIAHLPTWDYVFQTKMYESFITRESNRFNRSIGDYLTGIDALLEAERIEDHLLDIQQDMWDY